MRIREAQKHTDPLDLDPEFFWPQMALAYRLDAISQGKKLSNSRAQPPPTCPRNGYARIQNILHGAV